MLLPRLAEFKPDLLFISAGFDAHHDDMYHFLTELDVHWLTDQLRSVTAAAGGRGVISVLEGGYSLSSPISMPKIKSTRGNHSKSSSSSSNQDADTLAKGEADRATLMQIKSCASFENWSFAQRAGDGGLVKG
jgi:acetoin utilization deacetylase AcuC-like enzyme